MPTQLLKTKLYAPRSHPSMVSRPRLDRRLEEGMGRRLTLVSAPAGFGKTTLLADWSHRSGHPVAWISLDEADDELKPFLSYLAAALEKIQSGAGEDVWPMLCSPQPPVAEAVLTTLINELSGVREEFVLVLDDYHLVENPAVHEALSFLLDHLPPTLHLFVAARTVPPLPISRLRGRGQLVELAATDLRFTPEEASAFLEEDARGLRLSAEDVVALEERTEGWIAGLQLAAHAMRSREDLSGFIEGFAGSHRHVLDYLAEEVFNCQPDDVQTFLLRTSVLNRLSGPLCDALTGENNGRRMLEHLEAANLFVVPLDEERRWYRYHQLFAGFLRERLRQKQPGAASRLHCRASAWYEDEDCQPEAVDHALSATDFDRAVRLIEEGGGRLWLRGETSLLLRWLQALPGGMARSRPSLCIFYAGALTHAGRLDEVEPWLQAAENAAGPGKDSEDATVKDQAAVIRARVASMREDVPIIVKLSRKALERLPEDDPFLREEIALNLGHAYCVTGNLTDGERVFSEAAAIGRATGNMRVTMLAAWHQAMLKVVRGRLREADEILRQALEVADDQEDPPPTTGIVYVGIGELLYEWGDLDGAERYLKEGIERGRRGGEVEILASGYANLARVLTVRGDAEASLAMGERSGRIARWPFMSARLARLLLVHGETEEAARWAHDYSLTEDYRSYPRDFERATVARVLMAQGRLEEALELLEEVLEATETNGMTWRVIELLLLRSLALDAQGKTGEALPSLNRALALAEPEGCVRVFVDEGPPMAALLSSILERPKDDGPSPEYVDRLLSKILVEATRTDSGSLRRGSNVLLHPLTKRELEILRLVADGLSNQEIARHLYLSVGTVKAHVSHIYGKLLVRNRTRAVARARELRLLD